jgi:Ca2+-binding RTX toxin-like protein
MLGGPLTAAIDGSDTYAAAGNRHLPLRDPAPDDIACQVPAPGAPGTTVSIDESDRVFGIGTSCAAVAFYSDAPFAAVRGTSGPNSLMGTPGPTRIQGFGDDDAILVAPGDRGSGGKGDDRMSGSGVMFGGDGDDRLDGGASNPGRARLHGQRGSDVITGSAGRNRISGGPGRDAIAGRAGRDRIVTRDRSRDAVRCGRGRDVVQADRKDRVARDCERVVVRRAVLGHGPPGGSPARAAGTRRCASFVPGSRVVARGGSRVVYVRGGRVFACLSPQGVARRLPHAGGGIDLGGVEGAPVRLAGRYVAYASPGAAIGDQSDRLYVFDIRRGRSVLIEPAGTVGEIALKPNASVAWTDLSLVRAAGGTPVYEVRKLGFDERLGNVLVDRGADVEPGTLRLSEDGSAITWTRGGAERSAPLG